MLTLQDIVRAVLIPALVSAVFAVGFRLRGWAWALPAGLGAGFGSGFILSGGAMSLPPQDGTDWIFWAAIVAAVVGVVDSLTAFRGGWILGAAAGLVAIVIVRPLCPGAVSMSALVMAGILFAAVGAMVCLTIQVAEPRVGSWACVGALCVVMGGAAVIVLSSNLRIVGVYGLSAAAALGPIAWFTSGGKGGARSVCIVAMSLLAGLLAGGHFYPEPGVGWTDALLPMALPALLILAARLPVKRQWIRGTLGLLLIGVIVGIFAVPLALAAKKAAEENPYGSR